MGKTHNLFQLSYRSGGEERVSVRSRELGGVIRHYLSEECQTEVRMRVREEGEHDFDLYIMENENELNIEFDVY